ncbi:MAG: GGDEF domain-containing protein [Nitrospirae bacterium]|nr:GGDEF domain-containing protein [Nitrospirota bacterium]
MVYLGIAGSAVAVELMILQFGGHASPYYAGMILVGICVLGFIPAHLSFHVTSALLMYSIYFFPIILSESITDFKTFFMANFFMITIFGSTLLLRYMGVKSLINELSLKYELESALGELQKSELKYRSLVDSTEDSIYLLDRDYNYLFINKMHTSRLGISGGQYVGKSYGDFHSTEDTRAFTEIADRVFETGESIQNEYRSKIDGKYFLQTFSPVKGLYGEMTALTIISKNITERKHMEEQLRSLSLTDELTGIYNRRGVMTLAEHLLKLADRQKKGLFILYADLDNLKKVNDTFGHKEGDLALIETANLLKQNYRDSDIIGRIGGDEFVVIPVGTSSDNVDIITERFYKILAALNTAEDREYDLSISIGIAYYDPEFPCSVDELLTRADKSMYLQKRQRQKASA